MTSSRPVVVEHLIGEDEIPLVQIGIHAFAAAWERRRPAGLGGQPEEEQECETRDGADDPRAPVTRLSLSVIARGRIQGNTTLREESQGSLLRRA
jgi:hypothetical protein